MAARLIEEFTIWRPNYGGVTVNVYDAGTANLASLWLDEGETQAAANPQVLLDLEQDDIHYGRFQAPVYVAGPYELEIVGLHRTGIHRQALTELVDADASKALASIPGVAHQKKIEDWLSQIVFAEAYGDFGASATDNTNLIVTAMGAIGGGGVVMLPAGTIPYTQFTVPENVVLQGQGEAATILQSSVAGAAITLSNDSGLARLTNDGVNKVSGSIGIDGANRDGIRLNEVRIKRFASGFIPKGGRRHRYEQFSISDCTHGLSVAPEEGDEYTHVQWTSGEVAFCVQNGVTFQDDDGTQIGQITFDGVSFHDNAVNALLVRGGQAIVLTNPDFRDNFNHINMQDLAGIETRALHVQYGRFRNGRILVDDVIRDIMFRGTEFEDHEWVLDNALSRPIRLIDCIEALDTIVTPAMEFMLRRETARIRGRATVRLSGTPFTRIWALRVEPGQVIAATAHIVGRSLESNEVWGYSKGAVAHRPGSILTYDSQTQHLAAGEVVTGQTSGAKGLVVEQTTGTPSTVRLIKITGEFVNDEIVTDPLGGNVRVDGTLDHQAVVVETAQNLFFHEDDVAVTGRFQGAAETLELEVQSKAGITVEWHAEVWATITEDVV